MAYSRRNFATYHRSDPSGKGEKALADYRNKIIAFLVVTAAYTAFLYSSGTESGHGINHKRSFFYPSTVF
jgi:hypothetical protein